MTLDAVPRAGCGATGSGAETALASMSAGATGGGVTSAGGWATGGGNGGGADGTGGGVDRAGGFGMGIVEKGDGTGGAMGVGSVTDGARATEGSVCVAGKAGGRASWEIGSRVSPSSTLPLCTKTFAFGFATTTRGGPGTRPEGEAAGAPVTAGASGVAPRVGIASLRTGKRGVVLAAGGEPVSGGAAVRCAGGRKDDAVGVAGGGGREMLAIGLVTAVDHAGGTLESGAGVMPGGRIAAGFIGRVVAAEMFGRCGIGVEAGLSGRGGKLMRRVSRFGGFPSEFSESGGLTSSAMRPFLYVFREMFNGEIGDGNIFFHFNFLRRRLKVDEGLPFPPQCLR